MTIHAPPDGLTTGPGILLLMCCFLFNCVASPPRTGDIQRDPQLTSGYSLLHELVAKQSSVDKILLIKSASEPTVELIRAIALASDEAQKQIRTYADQDARIELGHADLPGVEQATRDAIESVTAGKLIFDAERFELDLLLTQYEATKYGYFLARQLAKLDPDDRRRQWLGRFSESYQKLYDQTVTRISQLAHE